MPPESNLEYVCEHPTNHSLNGRPDFVDRLTAEEYRAAYRGDKRGPALCAVCVSREHASHAF